MSTCANVCADGDSMIPFAPLVSECLSENAAGSKTIAKNYKYNRGRRAGHTGKFWAKVAKEVTAEGLEGTLREVMGMPTVSVEADRFGYFKSEEHESDVRRRSASR